MTVDFKLVKVEWYDSRGLEQWRRWYDVKEEKVCHCVTVGYLVEDAVDHIKVASSLADLDESDFQVNGLLIIPRCAIRKIVYKKKRKK